VVLSRVRDARLDLARGLARLSALACALGVLLAPARARASGEVWIWHEQHVRLHDDSPAFPGTKLRLMSNTRLSGRADGLEFFLARGGAIFRTARWFSTNVHGTAVGIRSGTGGFIQEYRGEVDLVPHSRLGDVVVVSRNRFEYVWREAAPFTRFRPMLRFAYAPRGATWVPFLFHEFFLRPTDPHVQETWSAVGIGRVFDKTSRVDLGYMLRGRYGANDGVDHVLWLALFFGVPESAPRHVEAVHLGGGGD